MPCSVCEHYFTANPCYDYDSIPRIIKEHIKKLTWFNELKPVCPCKECIVSTMCDRIHSLKCQAYNESMPCKVKVTNLVTTI